jgi:hypothetical protein
MQAAVYNTSSTSGKHESGLRLIVDIYLHATLSCMRLAFLPASGEIFLVA